MNALKKKGFKEAYCIIVTNKSRYYSSKSYNLESGKGTKLKTDGVYKYFRKDEQNEEIVVKSEGEIVGKHRIKWQDYNDDNKIKYCILVLV